MLSLSDNNQTDYIEAFNSTSKYLDDFLDIDNPYFEQMLGQINSTELQINKANSSDTEAPFLDLIFAHRGVPVGFLLLRYSVLFTVESLSWFISLLYLDLYVLGDDALLS